MMRSFNLTHNARPENEVVLMWRIMCCGFASSASRVPKVKNLEWTYPREELPSLLEGRVELETWKSTFDNVYALEQSHLEHIRTALRQCSNYCPLPWCGLCALCGLRSINKATDPVKRGEAWAHLARKENSKYIASGVRVAVGRQYGNLTASSMNAKPSTLQIAIVIKGLTFEIFDDPRHQK